MRRPGSLRLKTETYQIWLDVNFARCTFRGRVRITGELDSPTVRLNAVGLEIGRAVSGSHPLSIRLLEASQELELTGVPAGAREIEVSFSGKAPDDSLLGFYRSRQPPDYVLATQFESTGARRAFPCVDRPDQKATFDVEVTTDPGVSVLFNTPSNEVATVEGRQRVRFVRTPRMSTYLVFLAVGKFDVLRGTGPGSRVAVWTPPGDAAKGQFALGVAQKVLKEFENYYGVPYPLPKLDLVSLRDFAAGAMENWGIIASKERLLLADEATTAGLRRSISTVTAHEIAHQWFGDLVTMHWWDEIWLNESFAALMAFKVLDRLGDPSIWDDFFLSEMLTAFTGDSLSSTHPIRQAVASAEEIDEIFDEISYGKGASVLRMLEGFVGPESFRQGVHDYLSKFQYGNARSEDLWEALEAAARQPISDLMRRWVERPGHPVLIVHRSADGLHLEQRRFSITGDHPRQYWPIPLVARTDGTALRVLMSSPEITLNVGASTEVFLNEQALGFYRVLYDDATYDRLVARFERLASAERWLLTEDVFAFLFSGDVTFARWKSLIERAGTDKDPLVGQGVLHQLGFAALALYDDPEFVELYRRIHQAQTERLGLTAKAGEGDMERRLRDSALRGRILLDPAFARELAPMYAHYDEIDPDLRQAVALSYAQVTGPPAVEDFWRRLKDANDAGQVQMARALAGFTDASLTAASLDRASAGELPLSQFPWMLFEALDHPQARPAVWRWYQAQGAKVLGAFAGTSTLHLVYELLLSSLGGTNYSEMKAYFAEHPVPGAERGIQKGLEYASAIDRLRASRRA